MRAKLLLDYSVLRSSHWHDLLHNTREYLSAAVSDSVAGDPQAGTIAVTLQSSDVATLRSTASDLASWYTTYKAQEWIAEWTKFSTVSESAASDSTAQKWPKLDRESWTNALQSERRLDVIHGLGLVATYLDTRGPDLNVNHEFDPLRAGLGSGRWELRPQEWLSDGLARLEAAEDFQRRLDVAAHVIARYVQRRLVRLASRVRRARPRVHRSPVRPLTMSVTPNAPPHPSLIEGLWSVPRDLLAA
jgi:hypothetical protein